jgi:hypothetical protein
MDRILDEHSDREVAFVDGILNPLTDYFTLACAFRRSAQYRFSRADTALRAAADIMRVRVVAVLID